MTENGVFDNIMLMAIKDVSDLRIYQLSLRLLKEVYILSVLIEGRDRTMAIHLKKTAAQIAPLIAEGYAKKSSIKEFKRFLEMAMGSSDEMITHIRQLQIVGFANENVNQLIEDYRSLSKQINSMIKKWN